jgi:predicted Zn-dependent peptidase
MLGSGRSAILYQELVKKQRIFSELDCYISGDVDRGLFVIEGKLMKNVTHEKANEEIEKTLRWALDNVEEKDLQKVKNKTETTIRFNEINVLNRAMKLAYCEMLGDIELANSEAEQYLKVNLKTLQALGKDMLRTEKCSTLFYISKNAH